MLSHRLWQTREVLHQCLINPQLNVKQLLEDTDSYLNPQVGDLYSLCVAQVCKVAPCGGRGGVSKDGQGAVLLETDSCLNVAAAGNRDSCVVQSCNSHNRRGVC